jgi:hypothetical protein
VVKRSRYRPPQKPMLSPMRSGQRLSQPSLIGLFLYHKEKRMKTRKIIYADEGKVLTDGTIYGKIIYLADDANVEDFYEITDAEYQEVLKTQEEFDKARYDI